MALYVVVGDGEMPKKELLAQLTELWEDAEKNQTGFWFILQSKAEPTPTDETMVKWMVEQSIYYETIVVGDEEPADIYSDTQKTHATKTLSTKVANVLKTSAEDEGDGKEDAKLLVLFVNPTEDDPADLYVLQVIEAAIDAGYKALSLNDGCSEIDLGGAAEEEAEEPAPAKKVPSKKAGAATTLTREQLEGMSLEEVRAIAKTRNLEVSSRSKEPYVAALLGELPFAEAAETAEAPKKTASKKAPARQVEVDVEAAETGATTEGRFTVEEVTQLPPAIAMLVIHYNGIVATRMVSSEQALELLQG